LILRVLFGGHRRSHPASSSFETANDSVPPQKLRGSALADQNSIQMHAGDVQQIGMHADFRKPDDAPVFILSFVFLLRHCQLHKTGIITKQIMAQHKNITNENFAKNLRALMEKFGAKQEMISQDLGIAQSAVSNYLKGRMPRADTLLQIAHYFGTDPNALISGDTTRTSASPGLFGGEAATMLADLKKDLAEADASVKKIEEALSNITAEVKKCKTNIGVAKLVAWRIEGIQKVNSRRAN